MIINKIVCKGDTKLAYHVHDVLPKPTCERLVANFNHHWTPLGVNINRLYDVETAIGIAEELPQLLNGEKLGHVFSMMTIREIQPGARFRQCEEAYFLSEHFALIGLDDDHEGGEIKLTCNHEGCPKEAGTVRLGPGDALIFHKCHDIEGLPVISGNKHVLIADIVTQELETTDSSDEDEEFFYAKTLSDLYYKLGTP